MALDDVADVSRRVGCPGQTRWAHWEFDPCTIKIRSIAWGGRTVAVNVGRQIKGLPCTAVRYPGLCPGNIAPAMHCPLST
eukprot:5550115-Pyramimonas_sp.AAC.1